MELHGMHVSLLHQLTITRWFLLKYLAIVSVRFFCSFQWRFSFLLCCFFYMQSGKRCGIPSKEGGNFMVLKL
jgi:hypothetical protein